MPQTRTNPTNGNLEIYHDDLESWVPAVVDLPALGGKPVTLSPSDVSLLTSIANSAGNLSVIQAILGNNFYPEIESINSKITDIYTFRLNAILDAITLLQTSIDYSATLTNASTNAILDQTATLQSLKDASVIELPIITNLTLTNANTQYAYTFPAGTKRYAFKCRADTVKNDPIADVRYSWITGKVATGVGNYDILSAGAEELSQDYFESDKTIYFSSAIAATVLTIREWQ
ncbi:MAG: hypothetical protein HC781_20190 [Leptolyngbyaceae cyanobacterium CSU_1_4]|nr:hypothetical protein [Leptolyngbyaceae cyanobacterium CSU_1_4]